MSNLLNPFVGFMENEDSITQDDVFMEAYFGGLPELDKIDRLYEVIQEKYKKSPRTENPNTYKEVKEISKLYCKVFGFKKVSMYFAPERIPNAFTDNIFVFSIINQYKDYVQIVSGKGIYDTSHRTEVIIMVHNGLLEPPGVTGRHINAIILHEIGHNFDSSAYHWFGFIMDTICTPGVQTGKDIMHIINRKTSIEDNNDRKMDTYYHVVDKYDMIYDDAEMREQIEIKTDYIIETMQSTGKKKEITNALICLIGTVLTAVFKQVQVGFVLFITNQFNKRMGEQYADSLPTAYGYGLELNEGLSLMTQVTEVPASKLAEQSKCTIVLRDINNTFIEFVLGVVEAHGTGQERCKDCIIKLKSDLKKSDFPPEMKESLEKEIQRLEEFYQQLIATSPDKHDVIQKTFRRLYEKLFGGRLSIGKFFKRNQI